MIEPMITSHNLRSLRHLATTSGPIDVRVYSRRPFIERNQLRASSEPAVIIGEVLMGARVYPSIGLMELIPRLANFAMSTAGIDTDIPSDTLVSRAFAAFNEAVEDKYGTLYRDVIGPAQLQAFGAVAMSLDIYRALTKPAEESA